MNILLIEDDPNDIEFITTILNEDKITVFNSPPESVDNSFELIIMDYFFHGQENLSFLKFLEENSFNIPVIIISGNVNAIEINKIPSTLNALVLSKESNFKELLRYYIKLLAPIDETLEVDYKTLFLNLVHDLRNDLSLCAHYKDFKNELNEDEILIYQNKIIESSIFAQCRLESLSEYLNNKDDSFSNIKDAFEQIKNTNRIKESLKNIKISGDTDCIISVIPTFFLSVILKNLIENSIKYRSEGKELSIEVNCLESENEITLSVSDNSKGMLESISTNLFSEKMNSQDGLGLVVLNRIIKTFNGSIKVFSNLDVGTNIVITFSKK